MTRRRNLLARQPFKAAYTLYFVSKTILCLTFCSIYYLVPRWRPKKRWAWKWALSAEFGRQLVTYITTVQFHYPLSLQPGKEGERFVHFDPPTDQQYVYHGTLQSNRAIKPQVLGGTWYPRLCSNKDMFDFDPKTKVVLHFHGGGWVLCDSREAWYGHGLRMLSEQFNGSLVFCPEYRLATSSVGKWPAPLQDAVTSYLYLLELGIEPSQIILSGDSAGATIVLALLRYIVSSQSEALPLPAAALLWSPWVNGYDPDDEATKLSRSFIDVCTPQFLQWGIEELTDNGSIISVSDPYIAPLSAPFKVASVPFWIQVGTAEIFHNPVRRFVQGMRAAGNRVWLYEIEDALHDVLINWKLGFQEELKEGMRQAWKLISDNEKVEYNTKKEDSN